jgi:hypothetical protein
MRRKYWRRKFQQYHKLFESSQIVDKKIKDRLAPLPRDFMTRDTLGSSSSSSTPKLSVENFEMERVLVSV